MRAVTLPRAATPRVSSFETRSLPEMSTCPRRTVSPGLTRAVPDFTLTESTTPSRAATRSLGASNAYSWGGADSPATSATTQAPFRTTEA